MTLKYSLALSILACLALAALPNASSGDIHQGASGSIFNQQTHSAQGFGTAAARVDAQITLIIPDGEAGAVYKYLRATYVDHDDFIKSHFPGVNLRSQHRVDVSNFRDVYFDTPDLRLFKTNSSVRFRSRINTTDETDRKSGRMLVQVKITPPGHFEMRTELKFEVAPGGNGEDYTDAQHPLIGLIKPKLRPDFKTAMSKLGYDAYSLRYVLTNQQQRSRVYLDMDGHGFLSFSVDEFKTHCLWATATGSSVDIGLQEKDFTAADPEKRAMMWNIRNVIIADLKQHFPKLERRSDEKYAILLSQLNAKIWCMPLLARLDLLHELAPPPALADGPESAGRFE